MQSSTREKIITTTVPLLAVHGYSGTSMRDVALAVGIRPSVIYHYFPDKETLFQEVRARLNEELVGGARQLPQVNGAEQMLRQYILFRVQHREAVVALRQFFFVVKVALPLNPHEGYLPTPAYEDVKHILEQGVREGRFAVDDPTVTAKAIVHLTDGFLIEHYPHQLSPNDEVDLAARLLPIINKIALK